MVAAAWQRVHDAVVREYVPQRCRVCRSLRRIEVSEDAGWTGGNGLAAIVVRGSCPVCDGPGHRAGPTAEYGGPGVPGADGLGSR
jgi:hypothetical protein